MRYLVTAVVSVVVAVVVAVGIMSYREVKRQQSSDMTPRAFGVISPGPPLSLASMTAAIPGSELGQQFCWNGVTWTVCPAVNDPALRFYFREDMLNVSTTCATAGPYLLGSVSGTGSVCSSSAQTMGPGVLAMGTGTTATGGSRLRGDSTPFTFGNGDLTLCWRSNTMTVGLSTSVTRYLTRLGFLDSAAVGTNSVDAVQAIYDSAGTDGGHTGDFWSLETRSNSTSTVNTCDGLSNPSGTTVSVPYTAGLWHRVEVCVNPTGTAATLTVDGVLCATGTTNIPVGTARGTGMGIQQTNNTGSVPADQSLFVDYVEVTGAYVRGRPTFADSHITTFADGSGIGRPSATIGKFCNVTGTSFNEWCVTPALDQAKVGGAPSARYPLLIVLTGRGDNPSHMFNTTFPSLASIAKDAGAIVVHIPGPTSTSGTSSWNTSLEGDWPPGDSIPPGPTIAQDEAWITSVIQQVCDAGSTISGATGQWPCDSKKVWMLGHSAGSLEAYRYACDFPGTIAAVFMLSAFAPRDDVNASCAAGHFHLAHFHGTTDADSYDNTTNAVVAPNTCEYVSVEQDRAGGGTCPGATPTIRNSTLTRIKSQNGCSGTLAAVSTLDFDGTVGGSETDIRELGGCPVDGKVQIWRGTGSAHVPTITAAGELAIASFFTTHTK